MKKLVVLIVLFLFHVGYGQNVSEKKMTKTTIKSKFSIKAIKAYQETATFKIEDYYAYLALFSSAKTSDSLKSEIKNSIFSLFENENVKVLDITSKDKNKISLTQLLSKVENRNYNFSISNYENSIVGVDFWTTKYDLKIISQENTHQFEILQQINFKPIVKKFGSKYKEVWTIWLSDLE